MMDPKNLDRAAKAFKEYERIKGIRFPMDDVTHVTVTLRSDKHRSSKSVTLTSPASVTRVCNVVEDAGKNLTKELRDLGLDVEKLSDMPKK